MLCFEQTALVLSFLKPVSFLPAQMRYRREHLSGRTLRRFPLLDDLLRDVSDGMALLAVTHFYCPEVIKLEGMVSLSSTLCPA